MRFTQPLAGVTALLLGSVSLSAWTAPPAAVSGQPDSRVVVSLAGLDLETDAGNRALNQRLAKAARRACVALGTTHVADFHEALEDCYRDALARAMNEAHSARMAAHLARRSPADGR